MKELHELSAVEIGRLVNGGKLLPTEVVQYFLDRIKALNPDLNAFVYVKEEEALEAARQLERRLGAGDSVGPFAGVPFALKDFLPSKKGWTNTHGGVKCLEQVDPYNSNFCEAMEGAGGIAIGKTNAPAFGFRGTTDNRLYGPTSNPWDITRNAGGSSGGSAAAVAAGLVPIAEGGDAGGSIRVPAAWCGCYGFKATAGIIPNICRPDAWAATHPYCTPGGLTKNVEDAAVLLDLMAKYDPRDPISIGNPTVFSYISEMKYERYLRFAITLDFGLFGEVDPEIVRALEKVAYYLRDLGHQVDILPYPVIHKPYELDEVIDLWCKNIMVDSAMELQYTKTGELARGHANDACPEVWSYIGKAFNLRSSDFYEFNKVRTDFLDDVENVFQDYNIILSPVTTCLPVKNSAVKGETRGPGDDPIGFAETFIYNFTGHPAASCPTGLFSEEGLPLAVQVAGRKFRDADVFYVSKLIENFSLI